MKLKHAWKILTFASACFVAMPLTACGSFLDMGEEGTSIREISTEELDSGDLKITIFFTDEERDPVSFVIPKGKDGEDGKPGTPGEDGKPGENGAQGETGNGIQSIEQKFSEDGSRLILTIHFTDGSEPKVIEVPVIKGKDGVSISNVATEKDAQGNTVVTISFEGGLDDVSFIVPKPEKGETGNGIRSVVVQQNEDGSQTLTISYTDAGYEDTVVTIPAPEKGETGAGISYILTSETEDRYVLTFYFTDGRNQSVTFSKPTQPSTWLSGFSSPASDLGSDGDFYLNKSDLTIYQKIGGTWMLIAQLSASSQTHTVRFDANGGTFASNTFSTIFEVTHGDTFYGNPKYIFPVVTYEEKTFLGWYTSVNQNDPTAGKFTDLTPVYSDMILYAWWA